MLTITHPLSSTSSSPTSTSSPHCKPNLLPCRIKYNGPVNASSRYWRVGKATDRGGENSKSDTMMAHFRGRRLRGRTVEMPRGYKGIVLKSTGKTILRRAPCEPVNKSNHMIQHDGVENDNNDNDIEEDEDENALSDPEEPQTMRVLEKVASFKDMAVWGHEVVPEDGDVYIRGMKEWIELAGLMHGFNDSDGSEAQQIIEEENTK